MMNRDSILKSISKIEDKLLVAKILDRYALCQKIKSITHSDYLDPYQKSVVSKALSYGDIRSYCFHGGFDGAERTLVFFYPDNVPQNNDREFFDFLKVLRIEIKTHENYSHRDYLGSIMGLGIKREKIGDILVKEDFCLVTVMDEIGDYVLYNLTKVGNAKATVTIVNPDELQENEPKVKEISKTVASLRLDSVASAGFGIPRSKVADLIRGEKVSLNWEVTSGLTKLVKEGDTISIRGNGRVVLHKVGNTTKKDRIHILLKKLI